MLVNGKYSAWFRTPLGEGTGIVVLQDGNVSGGDTVIAYSGTYEQHGDEFSADISIKRHTAGQLPVFGIDDVDISLAGRSTGVTASCRGKSREAPGMEFEATLIRMADRIRLLAAWLRQKTNQSRMRLTDSGMRELPRDSLRSDMY